MFDAKHLFPNSFNLASVSGTREKNSLSSLGSVKLVEMVSLMDCLTVLTQNEDSSAKVLKQSTSPGL